MELIENVPGIYKIWTQGPEAPESELLNATSSDGLCATADFLQGESRDMHKVFVLGSANVARYVFFQIAAMLALRLQP